MPRLIASLLTCLALLGVLAAPARALTPEETAAVAKAEAYLNGITTMQARFLQVDPDGATHEGDVLLSRPGKMRLVYDPPSPLLMVADGVWLIYVDKQLDEVSHVDLDDTPAGLLLKDKLSFADPAVKLRGVKLGPGTVEITASPTKDSAAGQLTFVFEAAPFALKQWRVLDAQNKLVTVTLSDVKFGGKLDKELFRYDTRRRDER